MKKASVCYLKLIITWIVSIKHLVSLREVENDGWKCISHVYLSFSSIFVNCV